MKSITPDTKVVNRTLQAALEYASAGLEVFPIKEGEKAPPLTKNGFQDATTDPETIKRWWRQFPTANIGIRCTGLLVGDFDGELGAESKAQLEVKFGTLPRTWTIKTGGGTKATPKNQGLQYVYKAPKELNIRPGAGKYGYPGFDIRANDSYIVAVPSITRLPYETIDNSPIADAPEWLIDIAKAGRDGRKPAAPITADAPIPDGQRNDKLTRIAGAMRRQGADQATIEIALFKVKCQTPLPEEEIKAIAASVSRYEPQPDDGKPKHFNLTDYGNAERLVAQFKADIRYSPERGLWLIWNGKFWEWDRGNVRIAQLAKKTARGIYHEAADEDNDKERKALIKHGFETERQARLDSMITSAQSEPGISILLAELDTDHWLLNTYAGTVDLRTGTVKRHDQADLITKMVPIEYDPDASCPLWDKFLADTTEGDTALAEYLQLIFGVCLTGDMKDQIFFYLYGIGQNGKSTYTDALLAITGDYGMRVDSEMFMIADKGRGTATEALANIRGKRALISSEVTEGRKLNTGLLKDLTGGGEAMRARRLYEHEIEFHPQCKIVMFGNYKPTITESTLALWRRLKLIPFSHTVLDKDRDLDLGEKLKKELPGILAWAVRGCLTWQAVRFLIDPEAVANATRDYRSEEDLIADFISDKCILDTEASTDQASMKKAYHQWCEDNSIMPLGPKKFATRLIEKSCQKTRNSMGRFWSGIMLK